VIEMPPLRHISGMTTWLGPNRRAHRFLPALLLAPMLVIACVDDGLDQESSTTSHNSNASGTSSEAPGMDTCVREPTTFADLDAITPAGISGRAVLDRAVGTHRVLLTTDGPRSAITVAPESAQSLGTIEIAYTNQGTRHVVSKYVPCASSICLDIGVACIDTIEVDVEVAIRSDDGALNEKWPAKLVAIDVNDPDAAAFDDPNVDESRQALISVNLDALTFSGSLQVGGVPLTGWQITATSASFNATFDAGIVHDSTLSAQISSVMGEGESALASAAIETIYRFVPAPESSL
jgi:hypothetical protein